jgi:hypothetical protein
VFASSVPAAFAKAAAGRTAPPYAACRTGGGTIRAVVRFGLINAA